jgi:hypothetical protein
MGLCQFIEPFAGQLQPHPDPSYQIPIIPDGSMRECLILLVASLAFSILEAFRHQTQCV